MAKTIKNEETPAKEANPPANSPADIPPVALETATTISADDLAAPLAQAMPPATPGTAPETPTVPELRDEVGTLFDPETHKATATGKPMVNKNGHYYPRNLGRAPEHRRPAPKFTNLPGGVVAPAGSDLLEFSAGEDQYTLLAETYLQLGYGPLIALFTNDVRPTPDEHGALKGALANWLRASRAKEFSPGLAFAMTAGGIFVAKLEKPTVREKAALLWFRAKQIWAKWRGQKEPRPVIAMEEKEKTA